MRNFKVWKKKCEHKDLVNIPKGFRLAYDYEYLELFRKKSGLLEGQDFWWCNDDGLKGGKVWVCRLNFFDGISSFNEGNGSVGGSSVLLRGALICKKEKKNKKGKMGRRR